MMIIKQLAFKEMHPVDNSGKIIDLCSKVKLFGVYAIGDETPHSHIGEIFLNNAHYVFYPVPDADVVYTMQQLREISNFCEEQTEIYLDTL